MRYTIAQAAERIGLTAHTLRYYEKEGLLPFVDRDINEKYIYNYIHCIRH